MNYIHLLINLILSSAVQCRAEQSSAVKFSEEHSRNKWSYSVSVRVQVPVVVPVSIYQEQ